MQMRIGVHIDGGPTVWVQAVEVIVAGPPGTDFLRTLFLGEEIVHYLCDAGGKIVAEDSATYEDVMRAVERTEFAKRPPKPKGGFGASSDSDFDAE